MKSLHDAPIKRKLYLIIMGTVAAVLLLNLGLSLVVQVAAARDEVTVGLESLAKVLGASSRATVAFQDHAAAHEVLTAISSHKSVAWVSILLKDGSVFTRYDSPLHHQHDDSGQLGLFEWAFHQLIVVEQPITVDGEVTAYLRIAGDLSRARDVLLRQALLTLGMLIASLLLGFLLASRLQRLVSIPVQRLSAAMRKVADTRNFSYRVEKIGDDELGDLSDGFNSMLGQICEYDQELSHYRDGLEKQVAQRTEQLEHARHQAVAASRAKSEFLATMSHEIRTPMTGVIGFTELLEKTNLDYQQRDYTRIIGSSANALLAIIDEILDFSKMEANKVELDNRDFNVEDLLDTLRLTLNVKALEKGITLRVAKTESVPPILHGDPLRLRQILTNLLGNAVKFTDTGGIVQLHLDGASHKGDQFTLHIRVSDSGIGISPEQQLLLFKPFQQGDGSITRRYGGTGLGLVITKRLVEMMNGEITVTSTVGEGTVFSVIVYLRLPQGRQTPASSPSQRAIEHRPVKGQVSHREVKPALNCLRVLVVDDSPVNLKLAITLLNGRGVDVIGAKSGSEALKLMHRRPFDLVLMDLEMPGMSGIEATRRIRALHNEAAKVPVVAITAHAFPEKHQEVIQAGMNDLLSKPYLPEQLYAMVDKWCKGKRLSSTTSSRHIGLPTDLLVYDPEAALANVGGNDHAAQSLLNDFLTVLTSKEAALKAALAAGNWDDLYHEVHKLAGSAPVVGATALHGAAIQLQDILKLESLSVDSITASTGDLLLQISRFRDQLNDRIARQVITDGLE